MHFFGYWTKIQSSSVTLCRLKENPQFLPDVLSWSKEICPGFIALKKGEEAVIEANQDKIYILVFGEKPLQQAMGVFFLNDIELTPELNSELKIKELYWAFISKRFRGLGAGRLLIEHAKETARNQGAHILNLETLNPHLNAFYKNHGGKVICDDRFPRALTDTHPSQLLKINL